MLIYTIQDLKKECNALKYTEDKIINTLINQSNNGEIDSIIRAIQKTCDEEIKKFYTKNA